MGKDPQANLFHKINNSGFKYKTECRRAPGQDVTPLPGTLG